MAEMLKEKIKYKSGSSQQTTQIQSEEMRAIISAKKVKETKPEPISDDKETGKQKRRRGASTTGKKKATTRETRKTKEGVEQHEEI